MNCATHNDIAAVAYCRTCGKPLCASCKRDVKGVIYCENCLAERLQGVQPPQTSYQPGVDPGVRAAPVPGSGPNPALAGILSGFFPFGVGAVYTGQYAKGLAHLLIFTGLVWGLSSGAMGNLEPVLGIGMAFFIVYQIIDAIRSAKAVQVGQPPPDPFGLARTFSGGERVDTSKIPMAAVVLIGLGVLFLLHTMGFWFFSIERFWPVILIGIGAWQIARRQGMVGPSYGANYGGRGRSYVGPVVLLTLGTLFLIQSFDGPAFHRTWPLLLLVIGVTKLWESQTSSPDGRDGVPPISGGPESGGAVSGEVQPPTEVNRG
jgi:LiaI-LiaF-like transmembrane region/B-box zinc finger